VERGQRHALAVLTTSLEKKSGTYRTLSWDFVGFCLGWYGKIRPHQGSNPGPPPHQEASCYTDCAVPVAKILKEIVNTKFKNNIYY